MVVEGVGPGQYEVRIKTHSVGCAEVAYRLVHMSAFPLLPNEEWSDHEEQSPEDAVDLWQHWTDKITKK